LFPRTLGFFIRSFQVNIPMSGHLSAFPSLTTSEFEAACKNLSNVFHQRGHMQKDWQEVELVRHHDTTYLSVTRLLQHNVGATKKAEHEDEEDEINDEHEEQDDAALQPTPLPSLIHYDILLSPTYRVPVLYFHIQDSLHRYPPTMKTLYEHLIPPHFTPQTESGGVIGGLSIQDHPVTSRPVFFIHPCHTADVMAASVGDRQVTEVEYLTMWIGALGGCVGLNVPLALVHGE